ncbi:MAG TPA: 2-amino-4-hydroxy-6-hydroxymethyldihydropteridine diphosphokinase [Gammaproteobacteria bacterium]|nr:2-amino-4-hydroxy-6-hydroxymethyldihydropteridine diphosphokinase [Gammaproteobacteria bacterium]|tara:strand:+ start:178 stop:696 length:519 start_codon:yes stop_codon:yes gene_type:complete
MSARSASVQAWVGLGGNLNDPKSAICSALFCLNQEPDIDVEAVSSLYRTAPIGITDQPDFLNAVARIVTVLDPETLLRTLLGIESALGRVRSEAQFGPRTIDLDLLLYGEVAMTTSSLTLPHPRMHLRRFVLEPLFEIEGDLTLPGGVQLAHLLERSQCQEVMPEGVIEFSS